MNYNDDQLLSIEGYENLAKAYSNALKSKGFMIVQIDSEADKILLNEIFDKLYSIKSYLFSLGGFLSTGKFYSLNERQIKKLSILFDYQRHDFKINPPHDKTKCLLKFLSTECQLIKKLIELTEKTSYETQLHDIINARLNLLSDILSV